MNLPAPSFRNNWLGTVRRPFAMGVDASVSNRENAAVWRVALAAILRFTETKVSNSEAEIDLDGHPGGHIGFHRILYRREQFLRAEVSIDGLFLQPQLQLRVGQRVKQLRFPQR